VLWVACMQLAFDLAKILHALGEGVANPDKMIAFFEIKRGSLGGAYRE